MAKDMILMMKDEPVMVINFDEGKYEIVNEKLLPFEIQNKILPPYPEKENYTKYDIIEITKISRKNWITVIDFLSHRVLPLTRGNAKKIYQLFNFNQLQDDVSKAKIAIVCRAVSLQDNYWLKLEDDNKCWADVNLRENHLSEIVAQVALHGSSLSLTGIPHTPELTSLGAYAKAWIRENDGLYLHKLGAPTSNEHKNNGEPQVGTWESKIEVMVSNLLDYCNVNHLKYEAGSSTKITTGESFYTCRCKCMTTEDVSILSGMDFTSWCNVQNINPFKKALEIDADSIYKMWIVDYLISNRDRHGLNWGFFYNCNTMEILGCHPLYDHNNAFDIDTMLDKDRPYLYNNEMTMRQAAKEAMNYVDFYFTKEFTREDFLTDRQYKSFMERAKELNIPVKIKNNEELKEVTELDLE